MKNKNKNLILFWAIVLLTFTSNAIAQNYLQIFEKHKKEGNKNLEQLGDSLIKLADSQGKINQSTKIIHSLSTYFFRRNITKSIKYGKIEVINLEKVKIITKEYVSALYNLARFFYKNKEYDSAIFYYKKVVELNFSGDKAAKSYAELGRCYRQKGDLFKAASYLENGIKLLEDLKSYRSLRAHYTNLALVYDNIRSKESLTKAVLIFKKLDSLKAFVKFSSYNRFYNNYSLANLYTYKAIYDFQKAKKLYLSNLKNTDIKNDSLSISRTYGNLANLYNIEKKDSAEYFIKQGLKYTNNAEVKARLFDNYADYHIRKKELNLALNNIHNSLEFSINSKIENSPTLDQLNNSLIKEYTLYCLKKKAEIQIKLKQYKEALDNIDCADRLVGMMQASFNEEGTKLIWRRETSQAYLQGAYAAHLLEDPEASFSFMEKNKALLLSESILKNTEFENLPKNVSDKETGFKKTIYNLENRLSQNESDRALQDSLFNAKLVHEKYVDSLKGVYPKYFDRKINVTQVSLAEVQKNLKKDEAVVSYIWNKFDEEKEILLGLVTTKSTSKTFEVSNTDSLRANLLHYRKLISRPFETKEDQESYQQLASKLYQNLFPTEDIRNSIKGKNLTIIPDGDLQNIPFEALITEENSNQYLILESDVSYAYSYSFLKHNEKVKRETNQSFIGYSPVTFQETELSSLNDSEKEINVINNEFDGIAKLNDTATKQDFLAQSSSSKIIHLATHADAGDNPWIAFSDGKLELHELYTYKNNADLVTLSACNTSLGEVAKGEGVLSLARGFFYSGSKSVVSSLWEVNDTSTSEIMIQFYKNLKDGQAKSAALNNAKKTYINSHSLSEQSPYYWSSFVLIGDAGAIDLSNYNYLYLALGLVLILGIFFFVKKRFF